MTPEEMHLHGTFIEEKMKTSRAVETNIQLADQAS